MPSTFPCPACGGPNEPEAGRAQTACSYCGANLTVPAELRSVAPPKAEAAPFKAAPPPPLVHQAPNLLRKAQPIAIQAWNTFALWTWVRRALPTCLAVLVIGLCVCGLLGVLPFLLGR